MVVLVIARWNLYLNMQNSLMSDAVLSNQFFAFLFIFKINIEQFRRKMADLKSASACLSISNVYVAELSNFLLIVRIFLIWPCTYVMNLSKGSCIARWGGGVNAVVKSFLHLFSLGFRIAVNVCSCRYLAVSNSWLTRRLFRLMIDGVQTLICSWEIQNYKLSSWHLFAKFIGPVLILKQNS